MTTESRIAALARELEANTAKFTADMDRAAAVVQRSTEQMQTALARVQLEPYGEKERSSPFNCYAAPAAP